MEQFLCPGERQKKSGSVSSQAALLNNAFDGENRGLCPPGLAGEVERQAVSRLGPHLLGGFLIDVPLIRSQGFQSRTAAR